MNEWISLTRQRDQRFQSPVFLMDYFLNKINALVSCEWHRYRPPWVYEQVQEGTGMGTNYCTQALQIPFTPQAGPWVEPLSNNGKFWLHM